MLGIWIAGLPDTILLGIGALALGLAGLLVYGLGISLLAGRVDGDRTRDYASETERAAFALSVFILAFTVAEVRGNLGKASDAAFQEAQQMIGLDRALRALPDGGGAPARKLLADYAAAVASDDWPAMAAAPPSLSPVVTARLEALWREVGRVGAESTTPAATRARQALEQIDLARQQRFQRATSEVPPVFWWMIGAFLATAALFAGRQGWDRRLATLVAIRFGVFGLVVALILILDQPYRGQNSVDPAIIRATFPTLQAS